MTTIYLTDEKGSFTGQWFTQEAAQSRAHPFKNRGVPYILWQTKTGVWALEIRGGDVRTAVVVSSERALAIRKYWGAQLNIAEETLLKAMEV